MSNSFQQSKFAYLAVSEIANLGYCGGLLILNMGGRPVEFHCTAPVAANRAQQILYGAKLKEFVVCDQIARGLLAKTKSKPDLILVEDDVLCQIFTTTDSPVAWVLNSDDDPSRFHDHDAVIELEIAEQPLKLFGRFDAEQTESHLRRFMETLPIREPFERIYQAIEEAHQEAA